MHAALIVHRTSQSKHIHLKPLSTILDDFVLSFRDNEVPIKGIDIAGTIRTFTIQFLCKLHIFVVACRAEKATDDLKIACRH